MIVDVIATFECDKCGERFQVRMDPGFKPDGGSVMDAAEEEVRAGTRGVVDGFTDIRDGKHLCQACVSELDEPAA